MYEEKKNVQRCYRFAFKDDCKTSLIGQLLIRKVVNEYVKIPYDKIVLSRSSSGKPYLEQNDNFFFNVSHHGDFCVLAADYNSKVGIDVMKVKYREKRSVSEFFSLMRKQFSSHEWNFIIQPGLEKEQLGRFYRLWCLKESYVKAIGTGIVFDLQSLSFSCTTPILPQGTITTDTKLYEKGQLKPLWKFEETFLDDNHCVAVATEPIKQIAEQDIGDHDQLKLFNFLFVQ
ncbi:l-aminoadipate-semialdehyde dehydrogenase-phosphopantetheinyl transferase [Caerostris extrusa]|uniref:L-aminoadipate-semialdehyde dehydrogenase-phosphopantetheinyl transferase n=1 Tax=Caerostris extrusa TaxID=172846 RepID=A0AAV4T2X3_CAEEX|nr:l-aminoadipate-semialdehyde dehydrogenase-phosphopantetheinyl transferase [Caerostris extrusa]